MDVRSPMAKRLTRSVLLCAVVAVALGGLPARKAAGQVLPIKERQTLRPNATVEIDVVAHSVTVEGWDRDEIQVVGDYDSDLDTLEVTDNERTFSLRLRDLRDRGNRSDRRRGGRGSRLEVRVPRGVRLSLHTVSGSVTVNGTSGALTAGTVSGGVETTGDLASASLSSVSGSVTYAGNAPSVRLSSVSGRVGYQGDTREARLKSVNGSVTMEGGAETIEAGSVSGSVSVRSDRPVRYLEATSVSGSIRFDGELEPGGTIEARSHSGSVQLTLGADTDARFDLESFSGSLEADLPGIRDEARHRTRTVSSESLSFVTGSGAGEVRANSFSGSVRILNGGE